MRTWTEQKPLLMKKAEPPWRPKREAPTSRQATRPAGVGRSQSIRVCGGMNLCEGKHRMGIYTAKFWMACMRLEHHMKR